MSALDGTCGVYYNNRAAASIQLNRFNDAVKDALKAISLDSTNIKVCGESRGGKGLRVRVCL